MKIIIKAESDIEDKSIDFVLTNEDLNNYNFVDVIVGDNGYSVSVEDLHKAAKIFEEIRLETKEDSQLYDLVEALGRK